MNPFTLQGEPGHAIEHADEVLAMQAANQLDKHYPGHLWAVNVNSEGGVMIIKNYAISMMYGMVLHLKNVYQDPTLKSVMLAGGELLERAAMARKAWQGQQAEHVEGVLDRHQPKPGIII